MAKWILTVETNCKDPAREKEFNEWYDNIHVPDVLETPGVVGATRYANNEPVSGRGKFLAIYEVETDDIAKTRAAMRENMGKKAAQGRRSPLVEVVAQGTYRQVSVRRGK